VEVAGRRILIRVAGHPLADALLPALVRCRTEPREGWEPEMTLEVWDSVGSGVAPPRPVWSSDDYLPRDEVRGSGEGGIDVSYALAARVLTIWQRNVARGIFWTSDAARLPSWEPTGPLRNLLHWALGDRGLVLAHAAAVGTRSGGVLLVGRGGAGKSTTALVCVDAGWDYVSDDYCVLTTSGQPTAHAIYGIGKVSPQALARLPGLSGADHFQRDDGKVVLDLARSLPGQMAPSLPLRAVVIPRVAAATGTLRPLHPAAGARALAPSTLFQLPGARVGALSALSDALRGLPVFGLDVGPDFATIPAALLPAIEDAPG
jgi:hypothetical protein